MQDKANTTSDPANRKRPGIRLGKPLTSGTTGIPGKITFACVYILPGCLLCQRTSYNFLWHKNQSPVAVCQQPTELLSKPYVLSK